MPVTRVLSTANGEFTPRRRPRIGKRRLKKNNFLFREWLDVFSLSKGPFTQAIFVAATAQCNFCHAEVATSYDFIAILVQFAVAVLVCVKSLLMSKQSSVAKEKDLIYLPRV